MLSIQQDNCFTGEIKKYDIYFLSFPSTLGKMKQTLMASYYSNGHIFFSKNHNANMIDQIVRKIEFVHSSLHEKPIPLNAHLNVY